MSNQLRESPPISACKYNFCPVADAVASDVTYEAFAGMPACCGMGACAGIGAATVSKLKWFNIFP